MGGLLDLEGVPGPVAEFLRNYGWLSVELLWLLYAASAIFAVYSDRAGLTLSRHRYVLNAIFRLVGTFILFQLIIYVLDGFDPAARIDGIDGRIGLVAFCGASFVVIVGFVFTRLVVQRLRDAGIRRGWAYLMLLPGVAHLLMIVIALYPPSRPQAVPVPSGRLKQTLRRADATGWEQSP